MLFFLSCSLLSCLPPSFPVEGSTTVGFALSSSLLLSLANYFHAHCIFMVNPSLPCVFIQHNIFSSWILQHHTPCMPVQQPICPPGPYNVFPYGACGCMTCRYPTLCFLQTVTSFTVQVSAQVQLINGAQACNVFFQVGMGSEAQVHGSAEYGPGMHGSCLPDFVLSANQVQGVRMLLEQS